MQQTIALAEEHFITRGKGVLEWECLAPIWNPLSNSLVLYNQNSFRQKDQQSLKAQGLYLVLEILSILIYLARRVSTFCHLESVPNASS